MTIMPNLDENNVQSVEFEAPPSADPPSAPHAKHFSIDLSLELERQLDMESYPPSPSHITEGHSQKDITRPTTRESLDPHVLAHIIKQLRQSLLEVTKDRDELLEMVAISATHETELQDALQHMTDKATTMEVELSDARKKMQDDEDSINMLRTKVEESRRGLMRLQTENRRQSMQPASLDFPRGGISPLGHPPPSKRASFVPLTGRSGGHRRISSVSDSGAADFNSNLNSQSLLPPDGISHRRHSSIYGRISPSQLDTGQSDLTVELEGLRREVQRLKDELEHAKHEMLESNEAREASEMCVQALRQFIADNNVGLAETDDSSSVKLPTPPTVGRGHEEDESRKTGASVASWGFKLWKDATLRTPSTPQTTSIPPPPPEPLPQASVSAAPLSRKLGELFSSRGSVSSAGSNPSHNDTSPSQLQSNAARSVRDSVYSFSDASSVAEPASPPAEQTAYPQLVVVRDVSDMRSLGSSPSPPAEVKEVHGDGVRFRHPVVV